MVRSVTCILTVMIILAVSGINGRADNNHPESELKFTPIKESGEVLQKLATQMKNNYQKIRTWKGTYHFQDSYFYRGERLKNLIEAHQWKVDAANGVYRKRVQGEGRFAIDYQSDSLFTTFAPQSTQVFNDETEELFKKLKPEPPRRSVVTPENFIYMDPCTTYGKFLHLEHWHDCKGRVAFREPAEKGRNQATGNVIDPRKFLQINSWTFGDLFSDYARTLQSNSESKSVKRSFRLSKAKKKDKELFRLSIQNSQEWLFDSSVSFYPVSMLQMSPKTGDFNLQRTWNWKYRRVKGVPVPERVSVSTFDKDSEILFQRVWMLKQTQLNESIDPSVFSYQQLGLKEGERIIDHIEKKGYIYRKGKLTDPVEMDFSQDE